MVLNETEQNNLTISTLKLNIQLCIILLWNMDVWTLNLNGLFLLLSTTILCPTTA